MDIFQPTITENRRSLIELTKERAPFIYHSYVLPKKRSYEQQLLNLREEYKNETDETKRQEILSQANAIKREIEVYSV